MNTGFIMHSVAGYRNGWHGAWKYRIDYRFDLGSCFVDAATVASRQRRLFPNTLLKIARSLPQTKKKPLYCLPKNNDYPAFIVSISRNAFNVGLASSKERI
jgi:hypothetical protein